MKINYQHKPLKVIQLFDDIDNSFYIVTFSDKHHLVLYSKEYENKAVVWTEASGNKTTLANEIGQLIMENESQLHSL